MCALVPQTVNISHTAECKTNTPPSFLYHAASFISCLVRPLDRQPHRLDWARCCLGSIPGKPGWGFYGKLQISTPLGSPDPTPALLVKTIGQRGRSDPESKAAQSSVRTQRLLKEGPSVRAGHCLATPAAQTPSHPPPATPGLVTWLRRGLGSTEAASALPAAARERGRAHCSPRAERFLSFPSPSRADFKPRFAGKKLCECLILEGLLAFGSSGIAECYSFWGK